MMGHDPIKVDQVTIDVVEHFNIGRITGKENCCAASKDLYVAAVGWKPAQQQVN